MQQVRGPCNKCAIAAVVCMGAATQKTLCADVLCVISWRKLAEYHPTDWPFCALKAPPGVVTLVCQCAGPPSTFAKALPSAGPDRVIILLHLVVNSWADHTVSYEEYNTEHTGHYSVL